MFLERLCTGAFRNLQDAAVVFNPAANVIAGYNGQGKSNLLEAIGFLSVFRSFRTSQDTEVSRFQTDGFSLDGMLNPGGALSHELRVVYKKRIGKKVILDEQPATRLSECVGFFPTVFLGIEQFPIITEGPRERRRFLDLALSQMYPSYVAALIRYRRALQQRNCLLSDSVHARINRELETWDTALLDAGAEIIHRRADFLHMLQEPAGRVYAAIAGGTEAQELAVRYRPDIPWDEKLRESFLQRLQHVRSRELQMGRSLAGPHRDDMIVTVDQRDLRKHGSQGEQKSALFALKMGEMQLLQNHKKFVPTVLIDDLFSMLDTYRVRGMLEAIRSTSQVFLTTTDGAGARRRLREAGFADHDISEYDVAGGAIRQVAG